MESYSKLSVMQNLEPLKEGIGSGTELYTFLCGLWNKYCRWQGVTGSWDNGPSLGLFIYIDGLPKTLIKLPL